MLSVILALIFCFIIAKHYKIAVNAGVVVILVSCDSDFVAVTLNWYLFTVVDYKEPVSEYCCCKRVPQPSVLCLFICVRFCIRKKNEGCNFESASFKKKVKWKWAGHVVCRRDSWGTVTFIPRKQNGNEKRQGNCQSEVTRQTIDSEEIKKKLNVVPGDDDDDIMMMKMIILMMILLFVADASRGIDVVLTSQPSVCSVGKGSRCLTLLAPCAWKAGENATKTKKKIK